MKFGTVRLRATSWLLALLCTQCDELDELEFGDPCWTVSEGGDPACSCSAESQPSATPPPNLLVIVLDDVGVDNISAYTADVGDPPATPRIDQLAAEGVLFWNGYSNPDCSPTRTTLLTGRHARRSGVSRPIRERFDPTELTEEVLTIAEVLRDGPYGYDTSLIGKWHLSSYLADEWRTHAERSGFNWWEGPLGNLYHRSTGETRNYFHYEELRNGELVDVERYATTEQTDDAIGRMRAMSEPWFLWVAYNAVHDPVHRPPEDLYTMELPSGASESERFDAMVQAVDTEVGRLLDAMDPELRERTTVVLLADNGTQPRLITPPFNPMRGKGSVYQGGTRVPMIIAGSAVAEPGRVSEALVHTTDLYATLAELGGSDPSCLCQDGERYRIDGVSAASELFATSSSPSTRNHTYLYTERVSPNGWPSNGEELEQDLRMVRDDRWQLVWSDRNGYEFFELDSAAVDEGEDLLGGTLRADQSEALQRLRTRMERTVEDLTCSQEALMTRSPTGRP